MEKLLCLVKANMFIAILIRADLKFDLFFYLCDPFITFDVTSSIIKMKKKKKKRKKKKNYLPDIIYNLSNTIIQLFFICDHHKGYASSDYNHKKHNLFSGYSCHILNFEIIDNITNSFY